MKKKTFFIFCISVISVIGCQLSAPKNEVCLKNKCVEVEVVQKPEDITKGLMYRESLSQNAGMLFIFPNSSIQGFWMKNTLIALDMIWMDHTREVIHIEKNVPPCKKDPCPSYTPKSQSRYVLEVNAGHSAKLGIKVGDTLDFRLKNLE